MRQNPHAVQPRPQHSLSRDREHAEQAWAAHPEAQPPQPPAQTPPGHPHGQQGKTIKTPPREKQNRGNKMPENEDKPQGIETKPPVNITITPTKQMVFSPSVWKLLDLIKIEIPSNCIMDVEVDLKLSGKMLMSGTLSTLYLNEMVFKITNVECSQPITKSEEEDEDED